MGCSSPFMGRWPERPEGLFLICVKGPAPPSPSATPPHKWGGAASSRLKLLLPEHSFGIVESPLRTPCVSLPRPQKDAGNRPRIRDQLNSGPLRQPRADQGGRAAPSAALGERVSARPPDRHRRHAARQDRAA